MTSTLTSAWTWLIELFSLAYLWIQAKDPASKAPHDGNPQVIRTALTSARLSLNRPQRQGSTFTFPTPCMCPPSFASHFPYISLEALTVLWRHQSIDFSGWPHWNKPLSFSPPLLSMPLSAVSNWNVCFMGGNLQSEVLLPPSALVTMRC